MRRRCASRPVLLACIAVLRLIAILLSLELSGFAHAAVDGVEACSGVAQHEAGGCEGADCAPGCPSCHHWHAGLPPAPLPPASGAASPDGPRREATLAPYSAMPPYGADPDSVYRPPRSAHDLP